MASIKGQSIVFSVVFLVALMSFSVFAFGQDDEGVRRTIDMRGNEVDLNDLQKVNGFNEEFGAYVSFGDNSISIANSNAEEFSSESVKGYIIEFEEEPLIVKYSELMKKANENRAYIESHSAFNPVRIYKQVFGIGESDVKEKVDSHAKVLDREHRQVKDRIFSDENVRKSLTGSAISDNVIENNFVQQEFTKVFNGISLNVGEEEVERIKKIDGVKRIHLDSNVQAFLMDSVSITNADVLWQLSEGNQTLTGHNVSIAILDTGVDYTHEDLGGCFGNGCKVVAGYDFVNDDEDPMDDHGHGTHVAATAAGNGVLKGVAPDAQIYAYKVLGSGGSGRFSSIIAAIEMSVDPNQDGDYSDRVDIISMSLGGYGNPDDALSQAVDNAFLNGVISVVAAGNSGPEEGTIGSPGTARKAITVGATYKKDYEGEYWADTNPVKNQIVSFSSRGPVVWVNESGDENSIMKPDVVAPGAIICAARYGSAWAGRECLDDKHVAISGTSMATPHVTGLVALLIQKNRSMSSEEIKTLLKESSLDLGYAENIQGAGLVDGFNALRDEIIAFVEPKTVSFRFNPTNKTLVQEKELKLISKSLENKEFSLEIENSNSGASFFLSTSNILLNSNQEVNFNLIAIVDTELMHSNRVYTSYLNFYSDDYVLKIPISIVVENGITSSVAEIDLGIDIPSQPVWNNNFDMSFVNVRADKSQIYNVSLKVDRYKTLGFGGSLENEKTSDISHMFSTSSEILEFLPSEEKELSILVNVDNSFIPNGVYSGKLIMESSIDKMEIPISFVKYYTLTIDLKNKSSSTNVVWVYMQKDFLSEFFHIRNNLPYTAYLDSPGEYDFVSFSYVKELLGGKYVDIIVNYVEPEIFINGSESILMDFEKAKNYLALNISSNNIGNYDGIVNFYNDKFGFWTIWYYFPNKFKVFRFTDMPQSYKMDVAFANICKYSEEQLYFSSDVLNNFSSTINFGKDINFRTLNVTYNSQNVSHLIPQYKIDQLGAGSQCYRFSNVVNSKSSELVFLENQDYITNSNFAVNLVVDSGNGEYEETAKSPLLSIVNNILVKSLFAFEGNKQIELSGVDYVFVGTGPDIWLGKLNVDRYDLRIATMPESTWRFYFTTQGFDQAEHEDMPYGLYSSNGDLVNEGVLYGGEYIFSPFDKKISLPSLGKYIFKLERDYKIMDEVLFGRVNVAFDSSLEDGSPPFFKSLKILCEGLPCDIIKKNASNELIFSADANDGLLNEVRAQYLSDSIWRELSLENNNGYYRAVFPDFTEGIVTINISLKDDSNNSLEYIFSVLAESEATPLEEDCFDSDGFDINTLGFVEYNMERFEDVCVDDDRVREYSCSFSFFKMKKILKETERQCQYSCYDGACQNQAPEVQRICFDNDPDNKLDVKGNVLFEGQNYEDVCAESGLSVKQYFCVDDKLRNFVKRCPEGTSCSNGACY